MILCGRMQVPAMLAEEPHKADSKWEELQKNFNQLILHTISFFHVGTSLGTDLGQKSVSK